MPNDVVQFIAIYLPDAKGQWPKQPNVEKVNKLIMQSVEKIKELVWLENGETECLPIEFTSVLEEKVPERKKLQVQLIVTFEDIPKTKPFADKYCVTLPIANKEIDVIPSDTDGKLQRNEIKMFEWFMNCIMHEICHALGAFHATQGIMSGAIPLYNEEDDTLSDFSLATQMDLHTVRIVSEALYKENHADCWARFEYYMVSKKVTFYGNFEIKGIIFLKNTAYTNVFYYVEGMKFECRVPEDDMWDTVLILFVFGSTLCFKREVIKNGHGYGRTCEF